MATSKLSEKAGVLHITIEQGATFDPVMTWKDENGVAINLTGYTARMQIREDVDSATTLHESTTENSEIVLGGIAGTITFAISAVTTAALALLGYSVAMLCYLRKLLAKWLSLLQSILSNRTTPSMSVRLLLRY
jgi:hypothetical protein